MNQSQVSYASFCKILTASTDVLQLPLALECLARLKIEKRLTFEHDSQTNTMHSKPSEDAVWYSYFAWETDEMLNEMKDLDLKGKIAWDMH